METDQIIQGRRIGPEELSLVSHWLATEPSWNRTRLSRELCERWNWRNESGRLKDMACRSLLLKLERRGQIRLPARERPSPNRLRNRRMPEVPYEQTAIEGGLESLRPLRIEVLEPGEEDLALYRLLVGRYHYLGLRNCVGENLKYLVRDAQGRPLACLLFGSAAWKARARDEFIGWNVDQRQRRLGGLTNNTRFLILPWVRVPHLASHLLSRICRRISGDWMEKYGHPLELLETFVQRDRFRGTCYRAAGWRHVGATVGRSRNDRQNTLQVPVKDIFVYPLCRDFRGRLCA